MKQILRFLFILILILTPTTSYAGGKSPYSDRELAAAASAAYQTFDLKDGNNSFSLLSGKDAPEKWKIINVFDDQGVIGTGIYAFTVDTDDGNCIIAFRGTHIKDDGDNSLTITGNVLQDVILADLGLANSGETSQQHAAERYVSYIYEEIGDQYEHFTFVGHSLGGNLAEHALISAPDGMKEKADALSLDGPGFSAIYIEERKESIQKVKGRLRRQCWTAVGTILNTLPGENYGYADVPSGVHNDFDSIQYDEEGNIKKGKTDIGEQISHYLLITGDKLVLGFSTLFPKVKENPAFVKETAVALGEDPSTESVWLERINRNNSENRGRVFFEKINLGRINNQNNADEGNTALPVSDTISTDNQNETQTSANEEQIYTSIGIYAGPGTDYHYIRETRLHNIRTVIRIEGEWAEVELSGGRGYVESNLIKNKINSNVPRVTTRIDVSQNVPIYPSVYYHNLAFQIFDEARVYSDCGKNYLCTIPAGTRVLFLCQENNSYRKWDQIEFLLNEEKYRGYVTHTDLLALDNPLKNFEKVKETNALLRYEGKKYYSTSGEIVSASVNDWRTISEFNITDKKIDVLAGITAVIAGNDIDEHSMLSTSGFPALESGGFINTNAGATNLQTAYSFADFLIGGFVDFARGANKGLNLHVELKKYQGEQKIVISTGSPIEEAHAGKSLTLEEILVKNDKDNSAAVVFASEKANEIIKNLYPDLDPNKNYTMVLNFSAVSISDYGYYLVFDRDKQLYAVPIIHQGTSFPVYHNGIMVKNAAWDFAGYMMKVDDNTSERIIKVLEDNGFSFAVDNGDVLGDLPYADMVNHAEFNGHTYALFDLDMDWNEAREYCNSVGGYLASITSKEEDSFVYDFISANGYRDVYFGLSDAAERDHWVWESGEDYVYSNWHAGEPNHQDGYEYYGMYFHMFNDGTWNDGDGGKCAFLCEWNTADADVSEETEGIETAGADYQDISGSSGSVSTDEAKRIAYEYWGFNEGDKDPETGFDLFIDEPEMIEAATGRKYYVVSCFWFVSEGDRGHPSRLDTIYIDIESGEVLTSI